MSISECWFIRLNNEFVFTDPEPPIINIIYGWSGVGGQFVLCSFMFSLTSKKKCFSQFVIFILL